MRTTNPTRPRLGRRLRELRDGKPTRGKVVVHQRFLPSREQTPEQMAEEVLWKLGLHEHHWVWIGDGMQECQTCGRRR
jgi:hypothetical protein